MALIQHANDLLYALKGEDGKDIITEIRKTDGFVNATRLCQSAGKQWHDYWRLKKTQAFIKEMSKGIPLASIVHICESGSHTGTWVHPDVAIDLAAWCSPKFQVAVARLIRRYLSGELTTEESKQASNQLLSTQIQITDYEKKSIVYLGEVDTLEFKGIKVGSTDDIVRRLDSHVRDFGAFRFVKVFEVVNNRPIEKKILKECKILGVRKACKINNKMQTELVELSNTFSFDDLVSLIEKTIKSNIPSAITGKDKQIEELKNDNAVQLEKEKTEQKKYDMRQLELQIELEKLKKEEETVLTSKLDLERQRQDTEERCNKLTELHTNYQEQIMQKQKELDQLKQEEANFIDPNIEMQNYFEKYCDFGDDGKHNKEHFRIPCQDLYEHYVEHVRVPIEYNEFKQHLENKYKLELRKCHWNYDVKTTAFGIRLKDFVTKKVSLVVKLINEFVVEQCILDKESVVDTKVLYDEFEKFSKDKGFETIKQRGFSRQLFKSNLLKLFGSITINRWCIDGKKHGFQGIRLKTNVPPLSQIVEEFTNECCFKGVEYRTFGKDIRQEFQEFAQTRYNVSFSSMMFYRIFRQQNPDLVEKCLSKSERGFVGIVLRRVISNRTNHNSQQL